MCRSAGLFCRPGKPSACSGFGASLCRPVLTTCFAGQASPQSAQASMCRSAGLSCRPGKPAVCAGSMYRLMLRPASPCLHDPSILPDCRQAANDPACHQDGCNRASCCPGWPAGAGVCSSPAEQVRQAVPCKPRSPAAAHIPCRAGQAIHDGGTGPLPPAPRLQSKAAIATISTGACTPGPLHSSQAGHQPWRRAPVCAHRCAAGIRVPPHCGPDTGMYPPMRHADAGAGAINPGTCMPLPSGNAFSLAVG